MLPNEVWEGRSAKTWTLRTLITPLSWLYGFGWQVYLAAYKIGFKTAKSPHRPVICVGNLVVGGSGKSPLTIYIAKVVQRLGRQVVIGCSGYGAPHSQDACIAPDGPLSAAEWGDEPAMFRWLLPNVPLVVGRNRVLAAELVHATFPKAVLVMDDGFQHLPLAKQFAVVIDDPMAKNFRCLPAGPYREPRWNVRRANVVVPRDFRVKTHPMRIVDVEGKTVIPQSYAVLCALGNPSKFLKMLADQYPNDRKDFPTILKGDHDPLSERDLWVDLPIELPIIVTAKDWVKLRDRTDIGERQFFIAMHEVELEPSEEFKVRVERSFNE